MMILFNILSLNFQFIFKFCIGACTHTHTHTYIHHTVMSYTYIRYAF